MIGGFWSGMLRGTDGYPSVERRYDWYCIGGGQNGSFKATAIEFYGVKTKINDKF